MMKNYFVFVSIVLSVFWLTPVKAQISQGGTPRTFDLSNFGKNLQPVPVFQMIDVDVDSLRAQDSVIDPLKDRPWRFGENLFVDIDIRNDGSVIQMPNGDRIYRVSIYSPEAISLNLTFDRYKLPPGADLFVYSSDQSDVLGAFTEVNNQDNGIFATAIVKGDFITVEYFEPATAAFPGEVHLFRVTHGYRGIYDFTKAFGSSGSCQVNVACSTGTGWDNQINAVCMLVSGGSGFCTGSLVNNTANDGTPYILTANHCYSDPTSWVFYFNWQSATCANPGSSPAYNSISGATLKARTTTSDFCLVQMNSIPPSSYGVYYAGWNRSTTAATSTTCIHHPSADIKKITLGNAPTAVDNYDAGNGAADCWFVQWSGTACTEGGSSGSPLFDQNKRIVGQLYGGASYCGAPTASMNDYYGRFSVSWPGDGTNATRLSNWLDPLGTAPTTLDGYDPNTPAYALDAQVSSVTSPTGSTCGSTTVTPVVVLRNAGSTTLTSATVYYKIDAGTPVSQAWTGSLTTNNTTIITFPSVTATTGTHTIKSWSALPNGGTDANTANDTISSTFNLLNGIINTFPWTEGFENGGLIPECWTQSYVAGTLNWTFIAGTGGGSPSSAHGGSYNANFYEGDYGTANVTKLITPALDLSGFSTATLSFWHVQRYWSPDQDTLKVYYRTSSGGAWTLLSTYSTGVTSWTQRTITLPNLSADYYIAFEGKEMYGYGIGVDDINVSGVAAGTIATGTISGSPFCVGAAVSVPYTITGAFNSGNIFTAQLSDASGNFISPVAIGSISSTTSGTISATIPVGTTAGSGYRIRVISSTPVITGLANTVDLVVNTVPAQPTAITGQIGPCQATSESYSVTNVAGVTYTWSVPGDWIITSGQGTNAMTATIGASSGTVQVTPSNTCGSGTAQSITVTSSVLPSQPSAITGDNTPCQTSQTYSVTNVAGVSYTWSFPAGWSISSGQGTNSITVTPSATAGTVTVTPSTGCGNGTAQTLSVTPEAAVAQPSAITGSTTPCAGTSQAYSVTNEAGVTYTWSFPAGWVITAGQNTNSVTVTAASVSGTVTVTPSTACGNGTPQTLTVSPYATPVQPTISGSSTPCQGTSITYSVSNVAGETYNWSVPGDWTINGGQGSSSITVTPGSQSGNVSVVPTNACGSGIAGTMSVIVATTPDQPSVISGNTTVCTGASTSYSVSNVAGVTYTWSLPTGWMQTSGGNTSSITVTAGSNSGTITVTPSNSCGTGTAQTLAVTAVAAPVVDLGSDQTICNNETTTLDAGSGFSSYSWSAGGSGQTLLVDGSVIGIGSHTISVNVTNSNGCAGGDDIVITVEDCSGIEAYQAEIGKVFPNPASDAINISFAVEQTDLMIYLFDIAGKLLYMQSVESVSSGNVLSIPVSHFTAGTYTLKIVSTVGVQITSVVIK